MSAIISQQELTSALVIGGFRYWDSKRTGDQIPARSAFDPLIEIPALVRFMMLKDVQRDPLDFRYRLVGTGLRTHMTTDWTGKWMSQSRVSAPAKHDLGLPQTGGGNRRAAVHQAELCRAA